MVADLTAEDSYSIVVEVALRISVLLILKLLGMPCKIDEKHMDSGKVHMGAEICPRAADCQQGMPLNG